VILWPESLGQALLPGISRGLGDFSLRFPVRESLESLGQKALASQKALGQKALAEKALKALARHFCLG